MKKHQTEKKVHQELATTKFCFLILESSAAVSAAASAATVVQKGYYQKATKMHFK
jgi:hypothetical protein